MQWFLTGGDFPPMGAFDTLRRQFCSYEMEMGVGVGGDGEEVLCIWERIEVAKI